eukprot:scaffold202926_cov23-Tisochrysis_lutea.AAC.2
MAPHRLGKEGNAGLARGLAFRPTGRAPATLDARFCGRNLGIEGHMRVDLTPPPEWKSLTFASGSGLRYPSWAHCQLLLNEGHGHVYYVLPQ